MAMLRTMVPKALHGTAKGSRLFFLARVMVSLLSSPPGLERNYAAREAYEWAVTIQTLARLITAPRVLHMRTYGNALSFE
jgi:hypothetical protein